MKLEFINEFGTVLFLLLLFVYFNNLKENFSMQYITLSFNMLTLLNRALVSV